MGVPAVPLVLLQRLEALVLLLEPVKGCTEERSLGQLGAHRTETSRDSMTGAWYFAAISWLVGDVVGDSVGETDGAAVPFTPVTATASQTARIKAGFMLAVYWLGMLGGGCWVAILAACNMEYFPL